MSTSLPVLKPIESHPEMTCCGNENRCTQCPLHDRGICPGCNAVGGTKRCRMATCVGDCAACSGFKVMTPAICIKSPMRDLALKKTDRASYRMPKGRSYNLTTKSIIAINGGKRPIFRPSIDPKRYAKVEAIFVSVWRVWSTHGWYSNDLKDYLGIPKSVKLFLSTSVYDDALERAANAELHTQMQERTDIDGYMPLVFSIYTDDSVMNQYWAWRRTLKGIEEGGCDFFHVPDGQLFSTYKDVLAHIDNFGMAHHHFQITAGSSKDYYARRMRQIAFWHKVIPKHIRFFFEGVSSHAHMHAINKLIGDSRPFHFVSSSPWMAAHKGYLYDRTGKLVRSTDSQDELTIQAIENFQWLAEHA